MDIHHKKIKELEQKIKELEKQQEKEGELFLAGKVNDKKIISLEYEIKSLKRKIWDEIDEIDNYESYDDCGIIPYQMSFDDFNLNKN